jgi:hypothetical protein
MKFMINNNKIKLILKIMYIYVNGKIRPVETIPGMGGGGLQENGGGR